MNSANRVPLSRTGNTFCGGFTLLELLLAMSLLSVAFLALAAVSVAVVRGNALSKDITVATTLAQDKMESLRDTPYADIRSSVASERVEGMDRSWVAKESGTAPNRHKTVAVYVGWGGGLHSVSLETVVNE